METNNKVKKNILTKDNNLNLKGRTFVGIAWMTMGRGFMAIIQFGILIVFARFISPTDFGIMGVALVVIGFVSVFSQFGIKQAIVQLPNIQKYHIRTGFSYTLTLGILMSLFIMLIAPRIAIFFHVVRLVPILQITSLMLIFQGGSIVAESLLQRNLRFVWLAGIDAISYTIGFGMVGLYFAFASFGVWALVWANIAQAIIRCFILLVIQPHPKTFNYDIKYLNELLKFGGGFTLARFANYFALQGDNLIVGRYLGAEALGFYGRAFQIMSMPATLFSQVLDNIIFPSMAHLQENIERLNVIFRRGTGFVSLITSVLCVFMYLLAPEIINILLGNNWSESIVPLKILSIGVLFRTSIKFSNSLVIALGAVYRRAWRQTVYAILIILGCLIGKTWGITGVAWGALLAIFVNYILLMHLSLSLIAMTWKNYLKTQLPAILSASMAFILIISIVGPLRNLGLASLIVLLLTVGPTILLLCTLWYLLPSYFLGDDGVWIIKSFRELF